MVSLLLELVMLLFLIVTVLHYSQALELFCGFYAIQNK